MEKVQDSTKKTCGPKKMTPATISVGSLLGSNSLGVWEFSGVDRMEFQSSTCTCWKRRSKAASFSMYFLKLIKSVIFVVVVKQIVEGMENPPTKKAIACSDLTFEWDEFPSRC